MKRKWTLSLVSVLGMIIWVSTEYAGSAPNVNGAANATQPVLQHRLKTDTASFSNRPLSGAPPISIAALEKESVSDASSLTKAEARVTSVKDADEQTWQQTHHHENNTSTVTAGRDILANNDAAANRKPHINPLAYQRLQKELSGWELVEDKPTQFRLWIADLFDDAEHDFLSTRVELQLQGVKMSGSSTLIFKGIPKTTDSPQLKISAKDHHHGDDGDAWVSAIFDLSMISSASINTHPLEGETVYRLETTNHLNGRYTLYDVVYCEAFKFVQQEVFYAASNNKTQCPPDEQLIQVGTYTVDADQLNVYSQLSSLDTQQTWKLQKQYPSVKHPGVTNYFVSVYNGKQFESYTMQKKRSAMEQRINAPTGQYLYQIAFFDYLLPLPNGEYLVSEIGNFLYHHGTEVVGPLGEHIDSDLNLRTYERSLRCADIAVWYDSHAIAGQGDYQIDIISDPFPYDPTYQIDCYEYTSNLATGQQSLAFDLNYSPYDELLPGEVYSYVLRPKPQFAQWVEEIKLNLIYHPPH